MLPMFDHHVLSIFA